MLGIVNKSNLIDRRERSGIMVKSKDLYFPIHPKLQTPQRWFRHTSKLKSSFPKGAEIHHSSLNSLSFHPHQSTLQDFLNSQTSQWWQAPAHPELSILVILNPYKGTAIWRLGIVSSRRAVGEGWAGLWVRPSLGASHSASNKSASHWGFSPLFLCQWSPFVLRAWRLGSWWAILIYLPFVFSLPSALTIDNYHLFFIF